MMIRAARSCLAEEPNPSDLSFSTVLPEQVPALFVLLCPLCFPSFTCTKQEIKIDGEQIALARSSLLKRVVAGKQLQDVKKLSGYQSDRAEPRTCLLLWLAPARCLGLGKANRRRIPICFLAFLRFSRKVRQMQLLLGADWAATGCSDCGTRIPGWGAMPWHPTDFWSHQNLHVLTRQPSKHPFLKATFRSQGNNS